MRERVILSIANNAAINREARANAIDDTARARDEGFDVDVYFLADHKKFDLDLFIADADTVVKGFIIKTISFEMLIIRCSSSAFSTADADIWKRYRLIESL